MARGKRGRFDRDLQRRRPAREQARTFLIVVEGEETERFYFQELCLNLGLKSVKVVPYRATHPVKLVEEAIRLAGERAASASKDAFDEVWAVFDTEGQHDGRIPHIPAAREIAREGNVQLAISNPSFEFWIRLHFGFTTTNYADGDKVCSDIKRNHHTGYDKCRPPMDVLIPRTKSAIQHAQKCREHWESAGGDKYSSTDVDRLVVALNAAAHEDCRFK